MEWELRFSDEEPAVAIFVSRLDHCLIDLLHRWELGELRGRVAAVISNHVDLRGRGRASWHFLLTSQNKRLQEAEELKLLCSLQVDLVILARYMQILSDEFVAGYANRIINFIIPFCPRSWAAALRAGL
jgi:formyltetrahydrofolate deformylase